MFDRRTPPADRLRSLDAYRGFIMLAMVSGGFGFVLSVGVDGKQQLSRLHPIGHPGLLEILAGHFGVPLIQLQREHFTIGRQSPCQPRRAETAQRADFQYTPGMRDLCDQVQ